MVRKLENGITVVELGQGTTHVGNVIIGESGESSGIIFGNKVSNGKIDIQGDEVIIEIINAQGIAAYIKGIVELLKTWKVEGLEQQIIDLDNAIDTLYEKCKKDTSI